MTAPFEFDPAALDHLQRVADRARDRVLDEIAEDAQRYAPIRTGRLREGIHANHERGTVESEAPYTKFVEHGTEDTPAQPFLRPALYQRREIREGRADQ